ncbi:protein kinase domain-containing protein [Aeoliella sp. SH292]|uniref:protein kinase domain-containing protein n=1 Tax=Aeoliella sp. SH292 TaxID=3454464 RepID=UPI003F9E1620
MATTPLTLQLPDGYTACERIGSGGYGEVWRAIAPGGVEKAVKVVFGHCDEELAERELRSLERIRSVRHPFVISLERFEVVAGRLIIVTELADMSLDACFRKHQAAGSTGIPREELLKYLLDAAEALDYLVGSHSLQHLDIKPENLLVVGDHVKLGDFGLVKELASRTINSLMGGMTPLYSAPEVFDDAPTSRSDQYSLAIVYQQMLTGQLPFSGRTPAQLAKQHTQAEPVLHMLTEGDRRVIGRALAKRPEHRFDSCREMIDALVSGGLPAVVRVASPHNAGSLACEANDNIDTEANSNLHTQPVARHAGSAAPASGLEWTPKPVPALQLHYPALDAVVKEVEAPEVDVTEGTTSPTLIVGIGGLGLAMFGSARDRLVELDTADRVAWLAIDTDRQTLKEAAIHRASHPLHADELVHIPLKRPKEYGDGSRDLLSWVSRRWLYNIPRSLETRGYRPLGRIAAVDHAETILHGLYAKLYQLMSANPRATKLRVVVLAGTSGGTGSGIAIDIAQAARSMSADLDIAIEVDALFAMPERSAGSVESLSIVNTYSLLSELVHVQRHGNVGGATPRGPSARFESNSAPFRSAAWIPVPPRNEGIDQRVMFDSVAEQLTLEATSGEAAGVLEAFRQLASLGDFRLQSFACTRLRSRDAGDLPPNLFELHLAGCSYHRAAFVLANQGFRESTALRNKFPLARVYETKQPESTFVAAALDVVPLQVAANLAEFYPDIADAAARLHTRDDIEWQDIRARRVSETMHRPSVAPMAMDGTDQPTLQRPALV